MAKRPGGVMVQGTEPTRSQLIPVITKWTELGKTAQLGPVLFCILVFFSRRPRHSFQRSGGEQRKPLAGRRQVPGDCAWTAIAGAPGSGSAGAIPRRPGRGGNPEPE